MDKTYIVNGTKLEVIMTLVGQSRPSQGYRYRWGICLINFQLWDNSKLRKLRYTLVWQAALRRLKTGIFEQLCRKKRLNHCMI